MINCRDKIYKSLLPHWTGIQGNEPEAVFKENRGVKNPILGLTLTSPYLIVNTEVQLSIPTKKEKRWEGLFYWLGTFVSVAYFHIMLQYIC